jgi:hypothetical protein
VDADAHLQTEPRDDVVHRFGAADGSGGAFEDREEPVAGGIDLSPIESLELTTNGSVVGLRGARATASPSRAAVDVDSTRSENRIVDTTLVVR